MIIISRFTLTALTDTIGNHLSDVLSLSSYSSNQTHLQYAPTQLLSSPSPNTSLDLAWTNPIRYTQEFFVRSGVDWKRNANVGANANGHTITNLKVTGNGNSSAIHRRGSNISTITAASKSSQAHTQTDKPEDELTASLISHSADMRHLWSDAAVKELLGKYGLRLEDGPGL